MNVPQCNWETWPASAAIFQWCTDVVLSKIAIDELLDFAVGILLLLVQKLWLLDEAFPCGNDLLRHRKIEQENEHRALNKHTQLMQQILWKVTYFVFRQKCHCHTTLCFRWKLHPCTFTAGNSSEMALMAASSKSTLTFFGLACGCAFLISCIMALYVFFCLPVVTAHRSGMFHPFRQPTKCKQMILGNAMSKKLKWN